MSFVNRIEHVLRGARFFGVCFLFDGLYWVLGFGCSKLVLFYRVAYFVYVCFQTVDCFADSFNISACISLFAVSIFQNTVTITIMVIVEVLQ